MKLLRLPSLLILVLARTPSRPVAARPVDQIEHLIVIYQENWSFDGLYGSFPGANGIANAGDAARQIDRAGAPYAVLPPAPNCPFLPADLPSAPFDLAKYLCASGKTPIDLIHEFYREQYQINGGKMNRFPAFSNAGALTMSHYDASGLPEGMLAREFTLCDNLFHSAFGGSFLNHIFLVAARAPIWPGAPADALPKLDAQGFVENVPSVTSLRLAVNTTQSVYRPHDPKIDPSRLLPPQTFPTIGDRLSEKGVSWAWYSGGWNDAMAAPSPSPLFQCHHQPFAYFKNFADGTAAKAEHLKDEEDFRAALKRGDLPAVSFIKPFGADNEHPRYADVERGQRHVADLVAEIRASSAWPRCAIVITYDENGGRWDHVAPPKRDSLGPGTRVPGIVVSPFARKGFVDHRQYETLSILKLIEVRWGLEALNRRDAGADPFTGAFEFDPLAP